MRLYAVNFQGYSHQDWLTLADSQLGAVRNVTVLVGSQILGYEPTAKRATRAHKVHRDSLLALERRGSNPVVST